MQKPQEQPTIKCIKCQKLIRQPNYIIHQARCKGEKYQSKIKQISKIPKRRPSNLQNEQQIQCQKSQVRQKNYLMHKGKGSENKKEQSKIYQKRQKNLSSKILKPSNLHIREKSKVEQAQILQTIPCPNCNYLQTLQQLDTHPQQCPHREVQCEECHQFFPISLIQQHQSVCTNRRIIPQINQHSDDQQQNQPINPFFMPGFFRHRSSEQGRVRFLRPSLFQQQNEQQNQFRRPVRRLNDMYEQLNDLIHLLAEMNGGGQSEGLSKQQIRKIKIKKYVQNYQQQLCTICYCNFQKNQEVMNLPCKHLFHPQCLGKWLETSQFCPICKKSCKINN